MTWRERLVRAMAEALGYPVRREPARRPTIIVVTGPLTESEIDRAVREAQDAARPDLDVN